MKVNKVDPNNLPKVNVLAWNGKRFSIGKLRFSTGVLMGCLICEGQIGTLINVSSYALLTDIEEEFKKEAEKYYCDYSEEIGECSEQCPIINHKRIGSSPCRDCSNIKEYDSISWNWIICPALNKYKAEQKLVNKTK